MTLEDAARWAEIVGGAATAIGVGLAVWGVKKTLPQQIEAFQKTRRAQRLEEVAEAFFVAVARYGSGLIACIAEAAEPVDAMPINYPYKPVNRDVDALAHNLFSAWELARLYGVEETTRTNVIRPLVDLRFKMDDLRVAIHKFVAKSQTSGSVDADELSKLRLRIDCFLSDVWHLTADAAYEVRHIVRHQPPSKGENPDKKDRSSPPIFEDEANEPTAAQDIPPVVKNPVNG